MREILFKAKRVDNGEWVEGCYFKNNGCINGIKENYVFIGTNFENYQTVVEETVCQYTGLTDKNGNKIFEGDVVSFIGHECRVVLEAGAFGLYAINGLNYARIEDLVERETENDYYGCYNDNFMSLWEVYWNFNCSELCIDYCQIIGNIHDKEE